MGLFLRAGLLMCRRVRHLDTRLPERPMVRLSPSAVMDGGYVVSACVFRPQGRSVTTRYSAVTTANDLGPGGDVFDGEAVTLLTSEMRGIGAGHLRRSGRWRTAA